MEMKKRDFLSQEEPPVGALKKRKANNLGVIAATDAILSFIIDIEEKQYFWVMDASKLTVLGAVVIPLTCRATAFKSSTATLICLYHRTPNHCAIRVWDVSTNKILHKSLEDASIKYWSCVAFTHGATFVTASDKSGDVSIWDTISGTVLIQYSSLFIGFLKCIGHNDHAIFCGTVTKNVAVLPVGIDAEAGVPKVTTTIDILPDNIVCHTSEDFALAASRKEFQVWNYVTHETLLSASCSDNIQACDFGGEGTATSTYVFIALEHKGIEMWDYVTSKSLVAFVKCKDAIKCMRFIPALNRLAVVTVAFYHYMSEYDPGERGSHGRFSCLTSYFRCNVYR